MKKLFTHLVVVAALAATASGCSKNNNPQPAASQSANVTALTAKKWRITGTTNTSSFVDASQPGSAPLYTNTIDVYASYPSCRRDDFVKFDANGNWTIDEGATMCAGSTQQSRTGTWSFNTAETELTILDPGSPVPAARAVTATVVQLNASTLQTKVTQVQTQSGLTATAVANTTYASF